jgi:hypothetical protein
MIVACIAPIAALAIPIAPRAGTDVEDGTRDVRPQRGAQVGANDVDRGHPTVAVAAR